MTNGESDRNTEWFDAPSDGPDGYRESEPEYRCLYCGQPMPESTMRMQEFTYCSTACENRARTE